MKVGDKVRDKFKKPRPGDTSIYGVIKEIEGSLVTIEMESGVFLIKTMNVKQFNSLYDIISDSPSPSYSF